MIAPLKPEPPKPVISEHYFDSHESRVTLYMPDLPEDIAASVINEVSGLRQKHADTGIDFQYSDGQGQLEISNPDLMKLAFVTVLVMTRHVQILGEDGELSKPRLYAHGDKTREVLNDLKAQAQSKSNSIAVRAIDNLMGAVAKIEGIRGK